MHKISGIKYDDDDGHYIVQNDTGFANNCKLLYPFPQESLLTVTDTIVKLLGQGTFGKVVEAVDNVNHRKCAIKIIRAVPKYRDASRIELRVLTTLKQNDTYNRNKCIHLRDCFDFRNHICIVTDLLSESVFDFLKGNQFVPFPSSHIQSFARQLFTSVACKSPPILKLTLANKVQSFTTSTSSTLISSRRTYFSSAVPTRPLHTIATSQVRQQRQHERQSCARFFSTLRSV
jgi:hypothetical protein